MGAARTLGIILLVLALFLIAGAGIYTTFNPPTNIVETTHIITAKTPSHTATYTARITYQPQEPRQSIPVGVRTNLTLKDPAIQELLRLSKHYEIPVAQVILFLAGEEDLPPQLARALGNLDFLYSSSSMSTVIDPETETLLNIEYTLTIGRGQIKAHTTVTNIDENRLVASITIETINIQTINEAPQIILKTALIALALAIPGAILILRGETQKPTTTQ